MNRSTAMTDATLPELNQAQIGFNEPFHRHDRRHASRAESEEPGENSQTAEPSTGDETRLQVDPHVHQEERAAQRHQVIGRQAADHESQFPVPGLLSPATAAAGRICWRLHRICRLRS
ncbi:hypothetical protein CEXT_810061 [Caerostris extrusa]|uniref:Uncharacterized protein n=1 Tax=Caerostris extrusa TaxID=172846 RepID=A0AAV4U1I2_CAEEX|nr:hypothetical protein CEXT_810061 [Caerostris extrusa]